MQRIPLFFILTAVVAVPSFAADWSQWRGPNHNNVADPGQNVPVEWSRSKNVLWRTDVPGRGHSSPTIVGDLIVLTTADERSQQQAVVAFDRRTGDQQWLTVINTGGLPEIHRKNTHASPTVACDGERFVASFNHHNRIETVALDKAGQVLWRRDVGGFTPQQYEYGYAASPTIYDDIVIVSADCDTTAWVQALHARTGEIVWQQDRPKKLNWASPIVSNLHGRDQLLICGSDMIASYNPKTGQPLWETPCLTMATGGTAVFDDGIVFGSGGYPKAETAAVTADGSGRLLWANNVKCYEQSLLAHDGYLYAFSDNGVAYCWDATTGTEMWKTRLRGPVSASPVLVGDTIYASNESGVTYVFKANPQRFESVATNRLGDESFATPTVVDHVIYLRVATGQDASRRESLYAIGNE